MAGVIGFLLLTTAGGLPLSLSDGGNPWAAKSGRAEALADIASGKTIKLYLQGVAGERGEDRTPGLTNCNPGRYDVPKVALPRFMPLGANYSESIIYTAEQMQRLNSATLFARDYNLTMFRKRRSEVLEICPSAKPDLR